MAEKLGRYEILEEIGQTGQAQVQLLQGQLHRAAETYRQALQLAEKVTQQSGRAVPAAAYVQLGLSDLLRAAEDSERTGHVIEILILQALTQQTLGDTDQALNALERALLLAEPEGYIRLFVDEGRPMAALLHQAARGGIAQDYVARLLAVCEAADIIGTSVPQAPQPACYHRVAQRP